MEDNLDAERRQLRAEGPRDVCLLPLGAVAETEAEPMSAELLLSWAGLFISVAFVASVIFSLV